MFERADCAFADDVMRQGTAQIAALLVSLHMKGETVEEIVGFAEAIRAAATSFSALPRFLTAVANSPRKRSMTMK